VLTADLSDAIIDGPGSVGCTCGYEADCNKNRFNELALNEPMLCNKYLRWKSDMAVNAIEIFEILSLREVPLRAELILLKIQETDRWRS
jgi:hypothetical protein